VDVPGIDALGTDVSSLCMIRAFLDAFGTDVFGTDTACSLAAKALRQRATSNDRPVVFA
jgi:hypothetical protein